MAKGELTMPLRKTTLTVRPLSATGLAAGLILALASVGSAEPPKYAVELLGPGIHINNMNEAGEIVGWTLSEGSVRAFVTGPDHPYELLPLPDGYSSAWAQGVSDTGVVVGSAAVGSYPEFGQAVSWTPDGEGGYDITFLGQLPGHTQSVAYAINAQGDIIGSSINPGSQGGPTVWFNSPSGVMNLSALGAPSSPKQISDQRVIVGINGDLFDLDTMQAIPLPPFPGNMNAFQGWGINNHNEVAGTAFFGGYIWRSASNWTATHGWQSLSLQYSASAQVTAYDINDDGLTVLMRPQPAAYFHGIGTFALEEIVAEEQQGQWAFQISQGAAVNNAGQIAAIAQHQPSGQSGVAIMTPVADSVPGDLNGDGVVNVSDLLILFDQWGACADCGDCPADLNGDCVVNVSDLLILFDNWG
jgi:hypothetical protein